MIEKENICIIGLGYVGLPLAVLFAQKHKVIGYDIDKERITSLKNCHDKTNEVSTIELQEVINKSLQLTFNSKDIANSNIFIITVPTPIYENKQPNLEYLISSFLFCIIGITFLKVLFLIIFSIKKNADFTVDIV